MKSTQQPVPVRDGRTDAMRSDLGALRLRLGRSAVFCLAILALLAACRGEDPAVAAQVAAEQAAAREAAADKVAEQFDAAVAAEHWHLAKGYGDILLAEHPDSSAAARVKPRHDEIRAKADAEREAKRQAALWSYGNEPVKGGAQLSAAIYAKENVDTDGSGARPVRLIFRDHPDWGRSAYLVLEAGDFDCYRGCRLKVSADGKVHTLPGSRPRTDEAIAMFIDDHRALWRLAKASKVLAIEFPTKSVGKRTAEFEVAGLDPATLPKWN